MGFVDCLCKFTPLGFETDLGDITIISRGV